jgi:hypothetical protein
MINYYLIICAACRILRKFALFETPGHVEISVHKNIYRNKLIEFTFQPLGGVWLETFEAMELTEKSQQTDI